MAIKFPLDKSPSYEVFETEDTTQEDAVIKQFLESTDAGLDPAQYQSNHRLLSRFFSVLRPQFEQAIEQAKDDGYSSGQLNERGRFSPVLQEAEEKEAELELLRSELEAARKESVSLKGLLDTKEQHLAEYESLLSQKEEQIRTAGEAAPKLLEEIARLTKELKDGKLSFQTLLRESDSKASPRTSSESIQQELDLLGQENDQLKTILQTKEETVIALETRIAVLSREIQDARDEATAPADAPAPRLDIDLASELQAAPSTSSMETQTSDMFTKQPNVTKSFDLSNPLAALGGFALGLGSVFFKSTKEDEIAPPLSQDIPAETEPSSDDNFPVGFKLPSEAELFKGRASETTALSLPAASLTSSGSCQAVAPPLGESFLVKTSHKLFKWCSEVGFPSITQPSPSVCLAQTPSDTAVGFPLSSLTPAGSCQAMAPPLGESFLVETSHKLFKWCPEVGFPSIAQPSPSVCLAQTPSDTAVGFPLSSPTSSEFSLSSMRSMGQSVLANTSALITMTGLSSISPLWLGVGVGIAATALIGYKIFSKSDKHETQTPKLNKKFHNATKKVIWNIKLQKRIAESFKSYDNTVYQELFI